MDVGISSTTRSLNLLYRRKSVLFSTLVYTEYQDIIRRNLVALWQSFSRKRE